MQFDFTQSQFDMASSVGAMLARDFPPHRLREMWAAGAESRDPWNDLAEIGLFTILVPEDLDGGGGNPDDVALLLDRVGVHAAPGPVVETALVAIDALVRFADDSTRLTWLPRITEGQVRVALVIDGRPAAGGQDAGAVVAVDGDRVAFLDIADVDVTAVPSQDPTRRLAQITWSASTFDRGLLSDGAAARAQAMAAFGTAAVLVGINSRLIEMTRDYVLERKQFGRVIGEFQAVKHQLADAVVANEAARVLVWNAAAVLADDTADTRLAASVAKSAASQASSVSNASALQLHGGIGFTWEHDLHLWMKRGKALEQAYGNHDSLRRALGRTLLERGGAFA